MKSKAKTTTDKSVVKLRRVENYPNTPVPCILGVVDPKTKDAYELFFCYRHSKRMQSVQVKVYKNSKPIEHLTSDMTQDNFVLEVIDENEKFYEYSLDLTNVANCRLPLEFSKSSKHPFAKKLFEMLRQFPALPNLDRFALHTPSKIVIQEPTKIMLSMADGGAVTFNPQCLFNVGGEPEDDFLGCLFGPIGCAISVAIAILLYSSVAE